VATDATADEARERIGEAIHFHLEGMKVDEIASPTPTAINALNLSLGLPAIAVLSPPEL